MRAVAFVLILVMVVCAACGVGGEQQRARNAEAVDEALAQAANGARLRHLMQSLPKGGDLHNHLDGAIYAETWLDWAAEDGLCVDLTVPAIREKDADSCAASGWITAQEARDDTKSSMRSQFARSFLAQAGRDVISSLRRSAGLQ